MRKLSLKHFIPGIIWFFIVLTGICIPRNDIPKVSSWLDLILDFDKMIHGGMFGLLAFLFMYPFVKTNKSEKKRNKYSFG